MMSPLPPLTPSEPEDEILSVLARNLGCDLVDVESVAAQGRLTPNLLAEVPRPLALALRVLPVWSTSEILWVAVADPMNMNVQSYFETCSTKLIQPVLAREQEVERLIQEHYGTADSKDGELIAMTVAEHLGWGLVDLEDLEARGAITPGLLAQIPADLARNAGAFPVSYTDKTVRVAMAEPLEPVNLMLVKATLRKRVQPVVVARGDIHFLVMWYYGEK